jgi:2-keto-3-deoxy-L-rhamnonate aldolase RhmA
MARWVERNCDAAHVNLGAIGKRFDFDIAEAVAQDRIGEGRTHVVLVPPAGVVRMPVRDERAGHRAPWVDVEVGLATVEARGRHGDEGALGHAMDPSTDAKTRQCLRYGGGARSNLEKSLGEFLMSTATFREKMLSGAPLAGTFLKTPHYVMVEVLAQSGLDFLCLDGEHAPFDRAAMDACMAVARALDFPMLVRVGDNSPREILQALDYGAAGIVVPHVDTAPKAEAAARSARFGLGGRGYAGSTRWAGYATEQMPDLLARSRDETIVIAQIEEPAGVAACEAIASTEGIDGLFVGPADLSVGYGKDHQTSDELMSAFERVGQATKAAGKAYMTFVPDAAKAAEWRKFGLTMFFIGSEHNWMRAGAKAAADGVHALK